MASSAQAATGTWGAAQEVPGTAALNTGGDAYIYSLSCGSAGNCSAGGYYTSSKSSGATQAFVVSEVNGTWGEAVQVPGSGADDFVNSVTCPPGGRCTAGGATIVASQK